MLKVGDRLVTGHRLVRFVGRGNFGEVWQATAPGNTYAALKFVNLEQSQGRKEYRSIEPLKHLRHANLLQMTAIWLLDEKGEIIPDEVIMQGTPLLLKTVRGSLATVPALPDQHRASTLIIAMPFADKNLMQLLVEYKHAGQAGIPRDQLLGFMHDAAKAIDFLNSPYHDLGQGPMAIRHCDVKPENLLLMGMSVVLCDFGVSQTMGRSATRKTAMGGSLAYMAPECLADAVSPHSDQFSLAMSYLELRVGQLPFAGQAPTVLMEQRRRGELDLSKLPKREAAVIRRATAVQPEHRYPSALAMVEALQQAGAKSRSRLSTGLVALGAVAIAGSLGAIAAWPHFIDKSSIAEQEHTSQLESSTPPWEASEKAAYALIAKPELSASQFQQAVESLCNAIDLGLPESRLVFPHPRAQLVLQLAPTEILFEPTFDPFAYSPEHGIATLQRTASGLTAVTYSQDNSSPSHISVIDAMFAFDRVGSLGWLDERLVVFSQRGGRQSVTALPLDGRTREVLFETSDDHPIDACMAASGQRAIVIDWDSRRLISLNEHVSTWTLPEVDTDDDPLLKLNDEGDWIAIWTRECFYVANLSGAPGRFQRLEFGDKKSAVAPNMFSFQIDASNGWLTTHSDLDGAQTQLVRFTLSKPQQYETIDLQAVDGRATCASLHKRSGQVSLFVGYGNSGARYFPRIDDTTTFADSTIVQEDSHDHEVIASATGGPDADAPQWLAYSIRGGGVFLQQLGGDAPTLQVSQSSLGVPRQMLIHQSSLIIGYDHGSVEVFDLNQCRLIYEAAARRGKSLQPSAVSSAIKS